MAVRQNIELVEPNGKIKPIRLLSVPLEDGYFARYKFRNYVEDNFHDATRVADNSRVGFHYVLSDGKVIRLK